MGGKFKIVLTSMHKVCLENIKAAGIFFSLAVEDKTPSGLLRAMSLISTSFNSMTLLSNSTKSSLETFVPSFAIFPLSLLPCRIENKIFLEQKRIFDS